MRTFLLCISIIFTNQLSAQVVNNTSTCDMLIHFYCSDGPFGSSTGCGDLCSVSLCVNAGVSGAAFPSATCHSDCKIFDFVIIVPKDMTNCVDCTMTTFGLDLTGCSAYPATNGGAFGGCTCGSTVTMAISGSDINIW